MCRCSACIWGSSPGTPGSASGGVARVGQVPLRQVFVTLALSTLLLGEPLDPMTIGFAVVVVIVVAVGQRARVGRAPV